MHISTGRGLTLRVTYDDTSSEVISKGYTTSYSLSTVGQNTVTITYSENDVSLKTDYQVTVYDKPALVSENIEVSSDSYFELPISVADNSDSKATGYEIQVSKDAKFKKVIKRYNVSKIKYYTKEMTGLVSGRTCYVRVRSYKLVGKNKLYGAYSASKSIKVR